MKEANFLLTGKRDLSGRKIAIQGLGAVGFALAEFCLKENVKLIV